METKSKKRKHNCDKCDYGTDISSNIKRHKESHWRKEGIPTFAQTASTELLKEWHPNKNKKGPEEYLLNSNKIVWWKCSKGGICEHHEWRSRISHRTGLQKTGCPFCNGKPCPCNNFATKASKDVVSE